MTIDTDGFCYREMPIRSGRGITIISVSRDRVRLTFSEELSRKLELDRNLMFEVALSESESQDLAKFAEWI